MSVSMNCCFWAVAFVLGLFRLLLRCNGLCEHTHACGILTLCVGHIRRAQENKGMLMQAGTDRARLQ